MASGNFSIDVNPAVLRWARTAAGQSTADVAKQLGVSEQTVNWWEAGSKIPKWKSLQKLAKYYHRPIAALLLSEPPKESELPPDFRTLPENARRELAPRTLLAIRTARWLQSRAIEMRQELQSTVHFAARKVELSQDVDAIAGATREILGATIAEQTQWPSASVAYRRWRELLEEQGILVFQFPFPREEAQGFSLFDLVCPVIVVNESDVPQARIFTLFHEYGHLLLRKPGICLPQLATTKSDLTIEPFCNRFAAAVLIPSRELQKVGLKPTASQRETDDYLKEVARYFKVSKYVVLISLRMRGDLSKTAFAQIYNRWQSLDEAQRRRPQKPSAGGPSAIQKCNRQHSKTFISLVLESVNRGLITTHDAVTYLGVKLKDFRKLESNR